MQERRETLPIAKKLNKFIELPNQQSWKVHDSDVLVRGRVMTILRTKRTFLFDDLSSLKMRTATVTKQGFLVLYEECNRGLIINLRAATHVMATTDKYKSKKTSYHRGHIKIRLPRGNVHLFVRDEDVHRWSSAILAAHTYIRPKPINKPAINVVAEKAEEAVESSEEESSGTSSGSVQESRSSSSNSGLITVIENPIVGQIPSIRKGSTTVGSIRRRIEKKLVIRSVAEVSERQMARKAAVVSDEPEDDFDMTPKRYVSSLFVFHQGRQVPQIQEERNELVIEPQSQFHVPQISEETDQSPENSEVTPTPKPRKEWWMRSLRC